MNNTQQKYIKERLNEITRTLQNQINKNYPIPEVTIEDKINRIKEDKFEIIPNKYYISLDNCIKFTESKEDEMKEAYGDDEEKEERRRAAQKVFGKQG